jgi:hypothetical protein
LDISNNELGALLLPEGWTKKHAQSQEEYDAHAQAGAWYEHVDGRWQKEDLSMPLGVITLATAIKDMGALSTANVMGNNIGKEMISVLQEIMHSKPNLVSLCGIADDATEADLSGLGMDADDAIILASELPDKRALSSLNLASNNLGSIVGWVHHPGNVDEYKFIHSDGRHQKQLPEGEEMGEPEGLIAIANAIPDMRALTRLDVSDNGMCGWRSDTVSSSTPRQYEGLISLLGSISTLQQLDLSSNNIGADGATHVADAIRDNGALSFLNLAENNLGEWTLPEGWRFGHHGDYSGDEFYKHTDGREIKEGVPEGSKQEGIIAVANAIPDMGALIKLDIGSNHIGAEQERNLQRICVAGGIELAK